MEKSRKPETNCCMKEAPQCTELEEDHRRDYCSPPEKSREEPQGNQTVTTVRKPQGAAATSPQTRADPAMDPETRDPEAHHPPSRGLTEPEGLGMNFPTGPLPTRTQISNTCPQTQTPLIPSPQGHTPTDELHPQKADEDNPHSASSTHGPAPSTPATSCPPPHSMPRRQGPRPQAQQSRHHRAPYSHTDPPTPHQDRTNSTSKESPVGDTHPGLVAPTM
ncbi:hypothetical protein CRENBAI_020598 [Crenichthys baileyi]|uniref:Uncharacterized protein n=1 Tax=Crenichthys baileyi TaxID=28760 RepID=A0AAV9RX24_9TELE